MVTDQHASRLSAEAFRGLVQVNGFKARVVGILETPDGRGYALRLEILPAGGAVVRLYKRAVTRALTSPDPRAALERLVGTELLLQRARRATSPEALARGERTDAGRVGCQSA